MKIRKDPVFPIWGRKNGVFGEIFPLQALQELHEEALLPRGQVGHGGSLLRVAACIEEVAHGDPERIADELQMPDGDIRLPKLHAAQMRL